MAKINVDLPEGLDYEINMLQIEEKRQNDGVRKRTKACQVIRLASLGIEKIKENMEKPEYSRKHGKEKPYSRKIKHPKKN